MQETRLLFIVWLLDCFEVSKKKRVCYWYLEVPRDLDWNPFTLPPAFSPRTPPLRSRIPNTINPSPPSISASHYSILVSSLAPPQLTSECCRIFTQPSAAIQSLPRASPGSLDSPLVFSLSPIEACQLHLSSHERLGQWPIRLARITPDRDGLDDGINEAKHPTLENYQVESEHLCVDHRAGFRPQA